MKKAKSFVLVLLFLLLSHVGFTQSIFSANAEDVNKGGSVLTNIRYRNPAGVIESQIKVSESGVNIPISEFRQISADSIDKKDGKLILILYENHHSRKYQRDFFNEVLSLASSDVISDNDEVLFASFDWDRKELNGKLLDFPSRTATADPSTLIEWAEEVEPKSHKYKYASTRIYASICEGIDFLAEYESDKAKALFVLSSAYNSVNDHEWDATAVIAKGRQSDIPVFSIALDLPNVSDKYDLDNVCDETFGLSSTAFEKNKTQKAADQLVSYADQVTLLAAGSEFEISHISSYEKDGKTHDFQLSIDGSVPENVPYNTESPSFMDWVKDNPIIASAIAILFIGVIILIVILMKRRRRDQDAKEAEQARKVAELESQGQQAQSEIDKQKEILQHKDERERIQAEKTLAEEQEKARKKTEEETILIMSQSGFPRLSGEFQGQHGALEINKPLVSIGRKEANYYAVNHTTVSSSHAEIRFENGKYFIKDLNSSNGTMVNGHKIKDQELKHGDVVSFGEVTLTYLK